MKKKIILVLMIILVIVINIGFAIFIKDQQNKAFERYAEIKENVKKAVERNIKAQYPGCSISKEDKGGSGPIYNSSFLIKNGYIKKEELLDIDKKSYCDVYVEINTYFENPLDHQRNCETYYEIYLKCKDYEDEGYNNRG